MSCNRVFVDQQNVCPRCRYWNKIANKLANKVMKQISWEESRSRIQAEMEELTRDGLDPATILISEMRKYGHMF